MARNVALYPWFRFCQNLLFWQAIWFLYFQSELSAAEALLLYVVYDATTLLLEVPSGIMSDRLGRRRTLIAAGLAGAAGSALIALGDNFALFALAQACLGAASSFASGTQNALLYESLRADGRADEVEAEETRGWRFSLSGLALSAVTGGALGMVSYPAVFAAGALSMLAATALAWAFREPPHKAEVAGAGLAAQWQLLHRAFRQPVLLWLLALSVLMYGFSHVPFVFGQPFIAEALARFDLHGETPLVSGGVTAVMMGVSAAATLLALPLRARLGLAGLLLLAFALQVGLIGTLALTNALPAVAVLFLRMVPDSFAGPFIVARIQPLLSDTGRATYLSLQSFAGRLFFAASLLWAAGRAPAGAEMAYADIRVSLAAYALAGAAFWLVLALTVRRAGVTPPNRNNHGQFS